MLFIVVATVSIKHFFLLADQDQERRITNDIQLVGLVVFVKGHLSNPIGGSLIQLN